MKVRMLSAHQGSPDGIEIREYEAGRKYDLSPSLAEIFLGAGWAEEDKELVPPETKDTGTLKAEAKAAAKAAKAAARAATKGQGKVRG